MIHLPNAIHIVTIVMIVILSLGGKMHASVAGINQQSAIRELDRAGPSL